LITRELRQRELVIFVANQRTSKWSFGRNFVIDNYVPISAANIRSALIFWIFIAQRCAWRSNLMAVSIPKLKYFNTTLDEHAGCANGM